MKDKVLIVLLACLGMMGAFSIDTYLPALKAIAFQFHSPLEEAQQSLTIFLIGFGVMTLFYGMLSDSFGRRPVVLIPLVLYVLSSLGAAWAEGMTSLIVFRGLEGLTAGSGAVVSQAVINDLFRGADAQRMTSYVRMVFGLAPAVAPIIGGWLQAEWGWRSIFYFIALFALVVTIACWWLLPESLPDDQRHPFELGPVLSNYVHVSMNFPFMMKALSSAMGFGGFIIYVTGAPAFLMNILHLKETEFAWLFLPMITSLTAGSTVSGRTSHTWTRSFTISLGFAFMALGAILNLLYTGLCVAAVPWVMIPLDVYAFGIALASPAIAVQAFELVPHHRGMASAFFNFLTMAVFSLASGVISPLLYDRAFHLAWGELVFGVLAIGFYLVSVFGVSTMRELSPPSIEEEASAGELPL